MMEEISDQLFWNYWYKFAVVCFPALLGGLTSFTILGSLSPSMIVTAFVAKVSNCCGLSWPNRFLSAFRAESIVTMRFLRLFECSASPFVSIPFFFLQLIVGLVVCGIGHVFDITLVSF
jgi:hypothetical protein